MKNHCFIRAMIFLPLVLFVNVSCNIAQEIPGAKNQQPNVVLILIDTLRPDYLGFYGFDRETAAFLGGLAKNSVVFKRAFSTSSWTAPSTASLFTSKYPNQHGVTQGFMAHVSMEVKNYARWKETIRLNQLPDDLLTIAEVFKSMGYTAYGLAANVNIGDKIGFSRGFDRFDHCRGVDASEIYNKLLEWKEEIKSAEPFFLYLHFNDVHAPYSNREPYYIPKGLNKFLIKLYQLFDDNWQKSSLRKIRLLDKCIVAVQKKLFMTKVFREGYTSEIGFVDEYIGKIYKLFNMADNTIFAAVSDHGEEFQEHGYFYHGFRLYNQLTQVLMLFHAPSLRLKPNYIDSNVNLIDVLPTLIDLAGGKHDKGMEGISLAPLLKNGPKAEDVREFLGNRTLFAHRSQHSHQKATRKDLWTSIYQHWKLIENWDGSNELYDHRTDINEKHNIFDEQSAIASDLKEKILVIKNKGGIVNPKSIQVEINDDLLGELKSLGYIESE